MLSASHEHQMLLKTVERFMEEEIYPHEEMVDREGAVPLELGRQKNVPLPTTAVTNEFLTAARGMGKEKQDFAVVFDVLAHMSGVAK